MNKSNNVFKFQGNNMVVHAKGPNIDKNLSTSFRSNLLSSTMNLPRNFQRQGYAESLSSQRSMFYGRELSPTASVRSDFQPRNFHQPFNQAYSQRSTYYGRGGSPVSTRSIDSTASVATNIAQEIKSGNFNKHEWRIILEAVNNKRKHNFRRRAEKRRKIKLHFQNMRNRSGDDSGEQGSNSSVSSDDCMSTRTGRSSRFDRKYKENVPQSLPSIDSRSIETNLRKDIRDNREHAGYDMENTSRRGLQNMSLQEYKQNKPSNTFHSQMNDKNTFSSQSNVFNGPRNMFLSQNYMNIQENEDSAQRNTTNSFVYSTKSLQNSSIQMPKERFKSGFQFSSQRFNKSIMPIEEHEKNKSVIKNCNNTNKRKQTCDMDDNSSDDTIFLDTTIRPSVVLKNNTKNKNNRQKRSVECLDDVPMSAKKKCKTTLLDNNNKAGQKTKNVNVNNDFVFVKPQFPVRKQPIEKLISKSAEPYSDIASNVQEDNTRVIAAGATNQEKEAEHEPAETTQLTNSDVSMRPSFRKRKLFTQTLDITERKNNSSESLSTDSPQSNIYSALSREKHKTRKLTTSQSLLSRDVNQDDNNLLDLIHKIVPPSQVNTVNIAKPSLTRASGNKTGSDGDDKWDITSILSTCKNDSVSDTYTDDEIFKVANGDKNGKKNKTKENDKVKQGNVNSDKKKANDKPDINKNVMTKCNVIVQKLTIVPQTSMQMKSAVKAGPSIKRALGSSGIDAFWNTDAESDYECPATPHAVKEKYLNGTANNNGLGTPKQSSIKSFLEVRPNSSSNKILKNTKTLITSLVENKNDTTLVKALKKQTNKKITMKPNPTTLKNTNYKEDQPKQSGKLEKGPTAKMVKTRRQTKNLSAVEESCTTKIELPPKTNCSEANSKQNKMKATKEKIAKTQPASDSTKKRDRTLNDSQSRPDKAEKHKKSYYQLQAKTKVQDKIEDIQNGTICKVLRSRAIDLSSSFNSDKFELTGLSCRKSRTPSKRISFNKSRNATVNKGRNKK